MDPQLLARLDDGERRIVVAAARRRRFGRNEVVFHDGDPGDTIHLIAKGHFAIRITTPLGDVATVRMLGPGEHFGELAGLYGDDAPIVIAVTQDDLAQLAGTTRPTANRVLRGGEEQGVVRLARGRIEVCDLAALQRLAR